MATEPRQKLHRPPAAAAQSATSARNSTSGGNGSPDNLTESPKSLPRRRREPSSAGSGILLSTLLGIAAGAVYFLSGDLLYLATADLSFPERNQSVAPQSHIEWWAEFAVEEIQAGGGLDVNAWTVRQTDSNAVRIVATLPLSDIRQGVFQQTMARFLDWTDARRTMLAETPTDAERTLGDVIASLQGRIEQAGAELDSMIPETEADPRSDRAKLFGEWRTAMAEFQSLRRRFQETHTEAERLRLEPPPSRAAITEEQRQAALRTDDALQQDLRELHVRLAEARLQMLSVWQQSAEPLESLARLASQFESLCRNETGGNVAESHPALAVIREAATHYARLLSAFSENWQRDFSTLRQTDIDALRGDILDFYPRIRTLLSDFLYHGAVRLTEMREQINVLGSGGRDAAKQHVMQSNLLRGFQSLQTAHHRFEFSAGSLDTRGNFQLDAAMQGGRGLRRRTQHALRIIDERLLAEAVDAARKQHTLQLQQTEAAIRDLRRELDESIASLLTMQDALNINSGLTEEFLNRLVRTESAESRRDGLKEQLALTQRQLDHLTELRIRTASMPRPETSEVRVGDAPVNYSLRLRGAGAVAIAAFLVTQFVQWRTLRRSRDR
jgi:hypothetical protein